jgi:hypothetical protein
MVKEDEDFDLDFELVISPEDKVCHCQSILPSQCFLVSKKGTQDV